MELWPQQIRMRAYTKRFPAAALFVQQRLGKSPVVVADIKERWEQDPTHRALIICPPSALEGWKKVCDLMGVESYRLETGCKLLKAPPITFILWPSVIHNIDTLMSRKWDTICLDEATAIKAWQSQVTQFCCNYLAPVARYKYVLAGVPDPESALEFYPLFHFLDGHMFGHTTFWSFRMKYFKQGMFHKWHPTEEFLHKLATLLKIRCFCLTREQAGYKVKEEKITVSVDMPKDWRDVYDCTERDFEYDGTETIYATVRHVWLRYLASGLDPHTKELKSTFKYSALCHLWHKVDKPVAIIFSLNDEIEAATRFAKLGTYAVITGEHEQALRDKRFRDFNAGRIDTLFCQSKCVNMGADLSRASCLIFFSIDPSYLNFMQVKDRILNLNNSEKTLKYYSLQTKGTTDADTQTALIIKGWRRSQVERHVHENFKQRRLQRV